MSIASCQVVGLYFLHDGCPKLCNSAHDQVILSISDMGNADMGNAQSTKAYIILHKNTRSFSRISCPRTWNERFTRNTTSLCSCILGRTGTYCTEIITSMIDHSCPHSLRQTARHKNNRKILHTIAYASLSTWHPRPTTPEPCWHLWRALFWEGRMKKIAAGMKVIPCRAPFISLMRSRIFASFITISALYQVLLWTPLLTIQKERKQENLYAIILLA
jgi:hypothetical protein